MRDLTRSFVLGVALLVLTNAPALAQQSLNFKLTENAFNAGGHPQAGTVFTSPSFRVSLDALGEGVVGAGMSSASFRAEGGFPAPYLPPGEVHGLRYTENNQTLEWQAHPSAGLYNLYAGSLHTLVGFGDYGMCLEPGVPENLAVDPYDPPAGECRFYLVTVKNRLHEEGGLGRHSNGTPRPNDAPCP